MKYALIEKHAGTVGISQACRLLDARRQGYYEWTRRAENQPVRYFQDAILTVKIKNIFYESKRIYGARKIQRMLRRERHSISRKRIRRLMLKEGLVPVTLRRHVTTTDSQHSLAVFPNLLKQDFTAEAINRVWVSDFTYIRTDEGWLYLCSILDLYSRRVVGWAVSKTIDRHLAIEALENAVRNRHPKRGFIFHSDRGSQYASADFRNAVVRHGGFQSMSAAGNPYDNACAESFFRTLKVECIDGMRFSSRKQAAEAIAEYLLFYNRRRIHATLDYLTPFDFEQKFAVTPASS